MSTSRLWLPRLHPEPASSSVFWSLTVVHSNCAIFAVAESDNVLKGFTPLVNTENLAPFLSRDQYSHTAFVSTGTLRTLGTFVFMRNVSEIEIIYTRGTNKKEVGRIATACQSFKWQTCKYLLRQTNIATGSTKKSNKTITHTCKSTHAPENREQRTRSVTSTFLDWTWNCTLGRTQIQNHHYVSLKGWNHAGGDEWAICGLQLWWQTRL